MKLLLVEDSERLRQTLRHGLQGAGFTVDAAGDGVEACGFLSGYDYELVVLDLMLPQLDGIGVLHSRPAGGRRPRVLVLAIDWILALAVAAAQALGLALDFRLDPQQRLNAMLDWHTTITREPSAS